MKIVAIAGRMGTGKDSVAQILAEHGWVKVAFADKLKQLVGQIFRFKEEVLFGPSELRNIHHIFLPNLWHRSYFVAGDMLGELTGYLFKEQNEDRLGVVGTALLEFLDDCRRYHDTPDPSRGPESHRGLSARYALQKFGTEFGRALRDDVWVEQARQTIEGIRRGFVYDPRHPGFEPETGPVPPGVVITDCRFPNEAAQIRKWGGEVYWIDASKRMEIPPSTHASEPDKEAFGDILTGVIDNNGTLDALEDEVRKIWR